MKYYYAFFRDVDDNLYKVVVRTNKKEPEVYIQHELLLSDPPVTVTYETTDDIYEPHKCSTATVRMLLREFNEDFNSEDSEVVIYRLKDGEPYSDNLKLPYSDNRFFNVEWTGYATPNAYSQGYSSFYDEFELECQDTLSVLKYIDIPDFRTGIDGETPGIEYTTKTLQDILKLVESETQLKVFVTNSVRIPVSAPTNSNNSVLDVTFDIHSFLDNEEPKKYMDVLDDIFTALNLTIVQVKDRVYVINYDTIAAGYNTYVDTDSNMYMFVSEMRLDPNMSAGNTGNVSLVENYSGYKVEANYYDLDIDLPDLSDWSNRIVYDTQESSTNPESAMQHFHYDFVRREEDGTETFLYRYDQASSNMYHGLARVGFFGLNYDAHSEALVAGRAWAVEDNPGSEYFGPGAELYYEFGNATLQNLRSVSARYSVFATPCSIATEDFSRSYSYVPTENRCENPEYGYMLYNNSAYQSLLKGYQGDRYAQMYKDSALSQEVATRQPVLAFAKKWLSAKSGNRYMYLSCDATFYPDLLPTPWVSPLSFDNPSIDTEMKFLWVTLILFDEQGLWYYDDDSREWISDDPKPTRIYLDGSGNAFFNKLSIKDECTEERGFAHGIKGKAIKISEDIGTITGIGVEIHRAWGVNNDRKTVATFLQNIDFGITTTEKEMKNVVDANLMVESEYKSESKFTSEKVISTNYCTFKSGKAYNNILLRTFNGVRENLDYISNIATGDVMRPEYLLVEAHRRQYSLPTMVLGACTHSNPNMLSKVTYDRFAEKRFVVSGIIHDLRYNKKDITLFEKK